MSTREDEPSEAVPLLSPRDGLPDVVTTPEALARTVAAFAAGTGPVAVDAERASGYRYRPRAYLVQLRRTGAGTALVDPIACPDLSELGAVLADCEWVLHAASQDLPCLAELGMRPNSLFDTELAGRLAGYERVALGTLVERLLGLVLEKGHAAADWSRRPLPEPWLHYAALDVEVLVELRDVLEAQLRRQGKLDWAREEFAAVLAAAPPEPRAEPWRRTSGIHRLRSRRQLAALRALWEARDRVAAERDLAPGRIIPDSALVAAAAAGPRSAAELLELPGYQGRGARRYARLFSSALHDSARLGEQALPRPLPAGDGPPPANRWADRDPEAAGRLARARQSLAEIAEAHQMPVENLLPPDALRRVAWDPPDPSSPQRVGTALRAAGARGWQVTLTAEAVATAMTDGLAQASGH